jgi:cytochrome c peroxidase
MTGWSNARALGAMIAVGLSLAAAGAARAQDVPDSALDGLLEQAGVKPLKKPSSSDARNADLVSLGRSLFYDEVLSGNKQTSCATCHSPMNGAGLGDGLGISLGNGGTGVGRKRTFGGNWIPRHAPTVINTGLDEVTTLFWDGRVSRDAAGKLHTPEPGIDDGSLPEAKQLTSALAALALFPPTSSDPSEMGGEAYGTTRKQIWDGIMARLLGKDRSAPPTDPWVPTYRALFAKAYPDAPVADLNFGHAARAIAAFITATYTAIDTPLDRWLAATTPAEKEAALPAKSPERLGAALFFGKAKCANCHNGPLLSDQSFHDVGAPKTDFFSTDTGLDGKFQFKTPPLRNVVVHPNYFHGGSFRTLERVVQHYLAPVDDAQAIKANAAKEQQASQDGFGTPFEWSDPVPDELLANMDPEEILPRKLDLSPAEVDALVAFLKNGLTDSAVIGDALLKTAPDSVPSGLRGGVPLGDGSREDHGTPVVVAGAPTPPAPTPVASAPTADDKPPTIFGMDLKPSAPKPSPPTDGLTSAVPH